jgi:drug/metabolite transporter (DMT)-like permease
MRSAACWSQPTAGRESKLLCHVATNSPPVTRSALILAFATIYLVWGSTYLAIKVAVGTIPPFLMAGARFLVAGVMLYTWLWLTKKIRPTPRQWFDNAIVGALLLLGGNGLVSWASETTSSSITTLIISVGPLFIVLADWLVLAVGGDAAATARVNSISSSSDSVMKWDVP